MRCASTSRVEPTRKFRKWVPCAKIPRRFVRTIRLLRKARHLRLPAFRIRLTTNSKRNLPCLERLSRCVLHRTGATTSPEYHQSSSIIRRRLLDLVSKKIHFEATFQIFLVPPIAISSRRILIARSKPTCKSLEVKWQEAFLTFKEGLDSTRGITQRDKMQGTMHSISAFVSLVYYKL